MSIIDAGLFISYALIVLCALAAVIIPLIQSIDDPKTLAKSGIGLAILVVVFFISYAFSSPDAAGATERTSKLAGAGIISTYIFFFAAIIGIVYTEISKIIK